MRSHVLVATLYGGSVSGVPDEVIDQIRMVVGARPKYIGARVIRRSTAYRRTVCTLIGVRAGCPIAMGLSSFSFAHTVDTFWRSIPKGLTSLEVYVVDFAFFIFSQEQRNCGHSFACV